MKRDKNLAWRRVDATSVDLEGMKVAIVGGTGGIGRAFSRFMASGGASILVVVSPDLEGHSGAMFDRKGFAILPSPELTDSHDSVHCRLGGIGVSGECSRRILKVAVPRSGDSDC